MKLGTAQMRFLTLLCSVGLWFPALLLHNNLIVYGSGISDGDRHNHDELPILLAGGGGRAAEWWPAHPF